MAGGANPSSSAARSNRAANSQSGVLNLDTDSDDENATNTSGHHTFLQDFERFCVICCVLFFKNQYHTTYIRRKLFCVR